MFNFFNFYFWALLNPLKIVYFNMIEPQRNFHNFVMYFMMYPFVLGFSLHFDF